jgi:hypothetical protein
MVDVFEALDDNKSDTDSDGNPERRSRGNVRPGLDLALAPSKHKATQEKNGKKNKRVGKMRRSFCVVPMSIGTEIVIAAKHAHEEHELGCDNAAHRIPTPVLIDGQRIQYHATCCDGRH